MKKAASHGLALALGIVLGYLLWGWVLSGNGRYQVVEGSLLPILVDTRTGQCWLPTRLPKFQWHPVAMYSSTQPSGQ